MLTSSIKTLIYGLLSLQVCISYASSTSIIVSAVSESGQTETTAPPVEMEVPTTVIQQEEDLHSIIEAEATLDVTADESPEAEILTTVQ